MIASKSDKVDTPIAEINRRKVLLEKAMKKLLTACCFLGLAISVKAMAAPPITPMTKDAPMTKNATNVPYSCTFSEHGWNADDWMFVRRSDYNSTDQWLQKADHIENMDAASNSFTSMVLKKKWQGDFHISAGMAFTDRMAPEVMLASNLGTDAQGRPEYEKRMEVVLFDQGINVWLLDKVNGKTTWIKTAYNQFPLQKNTPYQLQVTRKGKQLTITVGDHTFGYYEASLPDDLYVGVTACEGINRLYNFAIK
jgi:hypothetical protein